MPEVLDDVAYLSQEIGARPAGTEEEQQAAFYIADQFKNRVGIKPQTEEFSCNSNYEIVDVIFFGLSLIMCILAMVRTMFVIPAIVVTLLCAVLFVLEAKDKPFLSKLFQRGVSQNIVAKYRPDYLRNKRTRKVIVVAHYDSGKVSKELSLGPGLAAMQKISAIALLAIPVLWIVRAIVAMGATGTTLIVWNAITVVLMLLALYPIVLFFMHNAAEYNEAANSNAAGVAALLELADRITNTQMDFAYDAEVHGEEAAREAGLIPEGAEVEYAVEEQGESVAADEESQMSEEERLLAAKAAVAALTGKPLREYAPAPGYDEEADGEAEGAEAADGQEAAQAQSVEDSQMSGELPNAEQEGAPVVETVGTPIPDWYRKAQEKADRSHWDDTPVRRSHYASALDEAVASSSGFFEAASRATRQEEAHIQSWRDRSEGALQDAAPMPVQQEEPMQDMDAPIAPMDEMVQEKAEDIAPQLEEEAALVAEEAEGEQPLAAEFMVEKPAEREQSSKERTAPLNLPTVEEPATESVMDDSEYAPGATRAMAPIDVSELRASLSGEIAEKPDLPEVESSLPHVSSVHKQRAPLAESSNPALSSQIPRINLDAFGVSTTGNAEPLDNKRAALRAMLPSMSGSITVEPNLQAREEKSGTVSLTGSFAPISATGSVGRVGDELVEGVAPEELYIEDADDSFSETTMTETGAYAGPGYVEMPESRMSRFFARFRKKDSAKKAAKDEGSAQEWLDVNDDFDPREVGAARGGWESFGNDDEGRKRSDRRADESDGEWNGGAFSKAQSSDAPEDAVDAVVDSGEDTAAEQKSSRKAAAPATAYDAGMQIAEVDGFYAKKLDVEVWFVALGSELAGNAGMKAFLKEHASELRGSIIFNLDSLGAGEFSYIDKEGYLTTKDASTRIRRYIKKAQDGSGVSIVQGSLPWRDSAASVAMKRRIQAVTLAGMEGGKPAYMGQGDDVMENVDANLIYDRVDFIETMVRSV